MGAGGSSFEAGYVYDHVQLPTDLGGDDIAVCGVLPLFQPAEDREKGTRAETFLKTVSVKIKILDKCLQDTLLRFFLNKVS